MPRFRTDKVAGRSMLPALRPGDWLLIRDGGRRLRPGDIVVARRPDRRALRIVKRVVRGEPDGWWLAGDNPACSDDSRVFGVVPEELIEGRVVARYWPAPRPAALMRLAR